MLTLPETLTHELAAEFTLGLKKLVHAEPAAVLADASALKVFDSSALAVLLACRREAIAAGKPFAVFGLPARLQQLARLYGVADLFPQAPQAA